MLAVEEVAGSGHVVSGGGGRGEADEMLAGGENQSVGMGRDFVEFLECSVAILEQNLLDVCNLRNTFFVEEGRTLTVCSGTMPCVSV
jgi:hypothetical protein